MKNGMIYFDSMTAMTQFDTLSLTHTPLTNKRNRHSILSQMTKTLANVQLYKYRFTLYKSSLINHTESHHCMQDTHTLLF